MFNPMKITGKQISIRPQTKINEPLQPRLEKNKPKQYSRSLSHVKNVSLQLQNQNSPIKRTKNTQLKPIKEKISKKIHGQKTQTKTKQPNKSDKKKKEKQHQGNTSQKKKKKSNFINLKELKPLNLQKEKQIFFQKNGEYDPFFLYPNISDLNDQEYKDIKKYDTPDQAYLPIALRILQKAKKLGVAAKLTSSPPLNQQQTAKQFDRYIKQLQIGDLISYQFVANTIAPTSVVHNNQECSSKINIGLPIHYRPQTIQGVMNHQIGTHFIRKLNDRSQKWYKDRKKYNMTPFLKTQQGLAALNQILSYLKDEKIAPLLFRPALMYYCCYLSSKLSFSKMYEQLRTYQPNDQYRWRECVRVKRGIADTSKPCGMYKDQIYFSGAIQILKQRRNINFINLHCGKMNVQDCLRLTQKNLIKNNFDSNCMNTTNQKEKQMERQKERDSNNNKEVKMKIPLFLRDLKYYLKCLDKIAEVNQIQ